MKNNFLVSLYCLFPAIIAVILVLLTPVPSAQLTTSENRILLQVLKLLEYPQALQGSWNTFTNFCSLPPFPSLNIVCTSGHVAELTVVGNSAAAGGTPLPASFSIDTFFTVLSRLYNLKALSLVSVGLWGPLPEKISRLRRLESLNFSSNFIYGEIPSSISTMRNLRSLVLSDNLFNSNVPDLTILDSLQELDLGGNNLGPEFPQLSKNLEKIILRNNSLRCQIPPELVQLEKIQRFDVSSNSVFGNIPSFLFSLPFLQYLNLASNHFSGSLSVNTTCGSVLTFVDISHNLLEGELPSCVRSESSNRTAMYSWNCFSEGGLNDQFPSSNCKSVDALAVKPPGLRQKVDSEIHIGLVLGVIGASLGITGVLALLIFSKYRAGRADNNVIERSVDDKFSVSPYPRPNINARLAPQTMRLAALGLPPYCNFTSEEIEYATNNFHSSNLIGEGSQGQLYKGRLIDGSMVLVNCIKLKKKSLHKNSMLNLKKALPNLRHRHLVSVLGHTVITYQEDNPQTGSTIFIVYEHISNVSLRDHLTDRIKKEMLKWPQRMAIIIGIARGIQFLHTGVAVPGIFGNNLKIENILLNDSLNAKVSGYSIPFPSKKVHHRTYNEQSGLNHTGSTNNEENEDIYQLGVILLQVITGKLITSSSEVEELKNELERGFSETASPRRAIDPSLQGSYAYESMRNAVQITINCLSNDPSNRPSIEDVLWNLQYSMQVQEARSSTANSPKL